MLAFLLIAALFGTTQFAKADPPGNDAPAEAEVTLPWTALGLSDSVIIGGTNLNQDSTVPVPTALAPRRLRGLMNSPINLGAGFLEVRDDRGVVLGTVELPPVSPAQPVVPFDIDVSAAQVTAATVKLSFIVRQVDGRDLECGPEQRLVLSDLAMVFGGTDPVPTTIADFFPSVLLGATIYAPADADRAEQESVLSLASAVTRLYGPQPIVTTVVTQPRGTAPPPTAPLTRAIVVERGDPGVNVVNGGAPGETYLRVSGNGDQLLAQTSLVVNRLQPLAQVQQALVTEVGSDAGAPSDIKTFGQLNMNGKVEFHRAATFGAGFDLAEFGRRVDSLQVRLLATYTPVAGQETAAVMVNVNGQALYSAPLDSSGRVDAVFDVPRFLLRQQMGLDFHLTYTQPQPCGPWVAPLTFQLDPRSTVTARHGGALGAEFTSLPSDFSPDFVVGFDGSSPDQLRYASRVVVDLARVTSTQLTPHVVDFKTATESDKGALIVANSKSIDQSKLRPPISGKGASVDVNLPDALRTDITNGLGSVQVLADQPHQRTVVLITTTGEWSLVEPILDYIDRLPTGWAGLTGNVLAAGKQGSVVDLSIGVSDAIAPESASAPSESAAVTTWVALGLAAVAAAGAAFWWLRTRRRRGARARDDW